MDWVPLLSAVAGASIALSGALAVEIRRAKGQRERDRELDSWRTCVDYALALDTAHSSLRDLAQATGLTPGRFVDANRAVHESGVYLVQERLLMSSDPGLAAAGERAFLRLVEIRDVVRDGASLQSAGYHLAYHGFADALWRFRLTVRTQFGGQMLTPQAMQRASWSDRERCQDCGAHAR